MNEQAFEFWNSGDTLNKAKKLIVSTDGDTWDADTVATMPNIITPVVLDSLPGRRMCMEIGAGIGRLVKEMNVNFFECAMGCDISPRMVEYSKDYLKDCHNAVVVLTDGSTLPGESGVFDFVYSFICFQHLQSYDEVRTYLKESLRILKQGGVIRAQTHCGQPAPNFQGMHGCYYRSLLDFKLEFLGAGFRILESEKGLMNPDALWVTAQKI